MPCMITGASDGMAAAWLATSRAPPSVGNVLEALPLDPEPVAVDRAVQLAGELADALGPAPLVDVGQARVAAVPAARRRGAREMDERSRL